jgi:Putative 2OG-Fe(II) oxygenase
MSIETVDLPGFGVILADLPKDLFELLKVEAKEAPLKNKEMISGLSGMGVPTHYYLENNEVRAKLQQFTLNLMTDYVNTFPGYMETVNFLTHNVPFTFSEIWLNYQKAYDFIPNHVHTGILSFSAWIKIPANIHKTFNNRIQQTGCFEFCYLANDSRIRTKLLPVDQSYEGKIIMFPSTLTHCVYPFYNTEDTRISLSGNIMLDTTSSAIRGY